MDMGSSIRVVYIMIYEAYFIHFLLAHEFEMNSLQRAMLVLVDDNIYIFLAVFVAISVSRNSVQICG
jgi:phosphotransferase system  glucose/maltose/N-acetylglucosamine-specific IIC component